MLDDPIKYGLLAALAIALIIAAITDLKSRKIANWLNGSIALSAPVFWWSSGMPFLPQGATFFEPTSIVMQFALAIVVLLLLTILFAMKAMGGGDVKLLAALALWIAPVAYLQLLVMMALLGGVLTLGFGFWHIMRRQRDKLSIPYGVAISLAGLWTIGTFYMPASAIAGAAG